MDIVIGAGLGLAVCAVIYGVFAHFVPRDGD